MVSSPASSNTTRTLSTLLNTLIQAGLDHRRRSGTGRNVRGDPIRPSSGLCRHTPRATVSAGQEHEPERDLTVPLYDFHSHSFFSDGELLPMELIRRASSRATRRWRSRTMPRRPISRNWWRR